MRIVVIASRYPGYPPLKGDQVRAYHQIRLLSRRHEVTLVCFGGERPTQEPAGDSRIEKFCRKVTVVPPPGVARWLKVARNLVVGLPLQCGYYFSPTMQSAVDQVLEKERPAVVLVQLSRMAQYLRAENGPPAVLDLVDSLALNAVSRSTFSRGPARGLWRVEARRLAAFEREACSRFAAVTVVSEADREYLGAGNVAVNPNGVDLEGIPFAPHTGRDATTLLFLGNMGYYANVDAVRFFVRSVLPVIRRRIPSVRFLIVGANPSREVRCLAGPNVVVTGLVESVLPYLSTAGIGVFPIRLGSGMQNKVLEAMAAGLPVVTTSFVLKGVRAAPHEHVMVGDTAEQFAACVIELVRSEALRRELAIRARRFVEACYSWEASVGQLEKILSSVAGEQ